MLHVSSSWKGTTPPQAVTQRITCHSAEQCAIHVLSLGRQLSRAGAEFRM